MAKRDFFLNLAHHNGSAADVAFFKLYIATYSDDTWAAYMEQTSDFQGCTRYGGGQLSAAYGGWQDFVQTYPDRYREFVADQLEMAKHELTAGNDACVCEGPDQVDQELTTFLHHYPSASIHDAVDHRLSDLRAHPSEGRFHCIPQ